MRVQALALIIATSAAPTAAEVPFMALPLDCTLGQTCFIEDYVDADTTSAQHDYTCGLKSRDGHKGTDIALLSEDAMRAGFSVLAVAPGVVEAVRDGVLDQPYTPEIAASLKGRECGNAVRIGHDNGYQTLYCHLKQNSLLVSQGTRVEQGTPLGQVGMSGQSNYAHVHVTVLKDGETIDPFAPDATTTCGAGTQTLWLDPPEYNPTGLFTASFTTSIPSLSHVQSGAARRDTAAADDNLVLYGFAFHTETGDDLDFLATGPEGDVFRDSYQIEEGKAQMFQASGRRAPTGGWPSGIYRGQVTLTRDGTILARRHTTIRIE